MRAVCLCVLQAVGASTVPHRILVPGKLEPGPFVNFSSVSEPMQMKIVPSVQLEVDLAIHTARLAYWSRPDDAHASSFTDAALVPTWGYGSKHQ